MGGNVFEVFAPSMRHWREQQDLEKTLVVPSAHGGRGPVQVDLDAGTVVVRVPRPHQDPGEVRRSRPRRTAGTDDEDSH